MDIESFLKHYSLTENPFEAEEARHDPVFARSMDGGPRHPDFNKILGQIDPPNTSIVFGEKGSGKTAIRLLIGQRISAHNLANPDHQALLVAYDDLNPLLDRVMARRRASSSKWADAEQLLDGFRLQDHQDAILSLAVTKLVDLLVSRGDDRGEAMAASPQVEQRFRKAPRRVRVDAAVLAALYDQPRSGGGATRWRKLHARLRLRRITAATAAGYGGTAMMIVAIGLLIAQLLQKTPPIPLTISLGITMASTVLLLGLSIAQHARLWRLSRRIAHEMPAMDRTAAALRRMLMDLSRSDLNRQDWPLPGADSRNSRYQLTSQLIEVLDLLGFAAMVVVVDRVDEPTIISGNAQRMRRVIWPLFDNKFLQQDRVAVKMLLPIELRHMLHRESDEFFQEARLDKQHLIDPLTWSGATLYDLCSARLRACCHRDEKQPIVLTDLFETDVTREMIIDALDQMHQPRDAFKFLYTLLQEHCRMVPQEQPRFKIPRLTVDTVRRAQSQRVQDLHRGLTPA